MLVRNWMTTDPITVDEDTPMLEAKQTMKDNNIKVLPVMKSGKLVGVITDQDIREASPSSATSLSMHEMMYLLSKVKVKDVMSKDPIIIKDDDLVDEAAVLMTKHGISSLPVVSEKKELLGIITKSDVFKVMTSLTGVHKGGIHFAFELEDRPGSIREVADVIREYGGRMVSILTSYEEAREGFRRVYIRALNLNRKDLKELKERLSKNFRVIYILDSEKKKFI